MFRFIKRLFTRVDNFREDLENIFAKVLVIFTPENKNTPINIIIKHDNIFFKFFILHSPITKKDFVKLIFSSTRKV